VSVAARAVRQHRLNYKRPYLYPKQLAAIFDPRRYSFIEASTKAGKTSGCIVWITEKAFDGRDGQNYWWIAPVSGQADIAFRRCLRAIPSHLRTEHVGIKTITLVNGAVLWFKSADKPDSLYGDDVYAAVFDEASRSKEDAWYAVRSTLTHTRGPVRVIGNVKGRKNWFYRMARKAQTGDDPAYGYHKITANDAVAAHVLAQEEIDDAQRNLPEHVFRELYQAEASDDGGNPFGLEAILGCVLPAVVDSEPFCWGWDLAKSQDYTVGIALDAHGRVCRFVRFQKSWEETFKTILELTGHTPALVDSTGVGDPILERLQKARAQVFEGYHFTSGSKQKLMEGLAVAIQSKAVQFPGSSGKALTAGDAGHIQDELEQFEYETTRTGARYSAPEGFHDDCVCSLALAVMHKMHARAPMVFSKEMLAALQKVGPNTRKRF
jgi:phage FluMu gp28-like protein